MKFYKVGEKSKAICPKCKYLGPTTFLERTVPLSAGKGKVENVLVAVCDKCDQVVSVPQQSVPRIQEAVHRSRHSVDTRIPRHLLDALVMVCYELCAGINESKQTLLFRYYLQRVSSTRILQSKLLSNSQLEEAQGKSSARFSIKLNDELYNIFLNLERETTLNKADLVRGIIIQMKKEILDEKKVKLRDSLKGLLLLAG